MALAKANTGLRFKVATLQTCIETILGTTEPNLKPQRVGHGPPTPESEPLRRPKST